MNEKFRKIKNKFNRLDDEEKAIAFLIGVALLFAAILLLVMLAVVIEKLFIPALVVLAIYGWGAHKRGWPVPKALKKFM